jgi:hypothetical protein
MRGIKEFSDEIMGTIFRCGHPSLSHPWMRSADLANVIFPCVLAMNVKQPARKAGVSAHSVLFLHVGVPLPLLAQPPNSRSNFEDIVDLHIHFKARLMDAYVGSRGTVEECFVAEVGMGCDSSQVHVSACSSPDHWMEETRAAVFNPLWRWCV